MEPTTTYSSPTLKYGLTQLSLKDTALEESPWEASLIDKLITQLLQPTRARIATHFLRHYQGNYQVILGPKYQKRPRN